MKNLSEHIQESFNEDKGTIVENQESSTAKEKQEIVENVSSENEEKEE